MALTAPPWWVGLAPTTVVIECSGTPHTLEWRDGRLRALDHDDVDAEEALSALGAAPPECLHVAALWRKHSTTPELITLGRRPGEATLGFEQAPESDRVLAVTSPFRSRMPAGQVREMESRLVRNHELRTLLSLPAPLIDRLVLTVMADAAARWDDDSFRADHGLRLGAALSVRAEPALRRLGQRLGSGIAEVAISPARSDRGGPTVAARVDGGEDIVVSAELSVAWLSEVWGRGISEPGDAFVLSVVGGDDAGREFDVLVAEWESVGPLTWEAVGVPARVVTDEIGVRRIAR